MTFLRSLVLALATLALLAGAPAPTSAQLPAGSFTVCDAAAGNDILIVLDNSGSVSAAEWAGFAAGARDVGNAILALDSSARIAVVHFAGPSTGYAAGGQNFFIERDFSNTPMALPTRRYGAGGSFNAGWVQEYLAGAMFRMEDALDRNPATVSAFADGPITELTSRPGNALNVVVLTDSAATGGGCCSSIYDLAGSAAEPNDASVFTIYNQYKSAGARFTMWYSSATTGAAVEAAGAVASKGGSFTGAIASNPADPEAGADFPRQLTTSAGSTITAAQARRIADDATCEIVAPATPEFTSCDDAVGNDVVFLIDNSGSVSAAQYDAMASGIQATAARIRADDPTARVAYVHFGGPDVDYSTGGQNFFIERNLTTAALPSPVRQYGPGGAFDPSEVQDYLAGAVYRLQDALDRNAGTVSPFADGTRRELNVGANRAVTLVAVTDSAASELGGCCSSIRDLVGSAAEPSDGSNFTIYNQLKGNDLRFAVWYVGAASSTAAAVASVGGTYTGAIEANTGDPEGSARRPRQMVSGTSLSAAQVVQLADDATCDLGCTNNRAGAGVDTGCSGGTPFCDAPLGGMGTTCVSCEDSASGGTVDNGCSGGRPICDEDAAGGATCLVCEDDSAGRDSGCTAGAPICDESVPGGRCLSCRTAADCNDGNACTTDACSAGRCTNRNLPLGTTCERTNICDGAGDCVECINDEAGTTTDTGCSTREPICEAPSGAAGTECVECLTDRHCPSGEFCNTTTNMCVPGCRSDAECGGATPVCDVDDMTCVPCINSAGGTTTDRGCSGAEPICDAPSGTPGTECVECANNSHCPGAEVCDLGTNTCAPPAGCRTDADCSGATPVCDVDEMDCVVCINDMSGAAVDNGCDGATPLCNGPTGEPGRRCVECVTTADCAAGEVCGAGNMCAPGMMGDDNDMDGIPDDVDVDDDNDGILDSVELGGTDLSDDEDGDGVPDWNDPTFVTCDDSDPDGVCDMIAPEVDEDGDGIPNHFDLDADGDGLPDATEGHDANMDGVPDTAPSGTDSDMDGLDDAFDPAMGGTMAEAQDTDNDGAPDFLDVDSDGDSVPDATEGHDGDMDGAPDTAPSGVDANGNGLDDAYDPDAGGTPADAPDADGDMHPDYLDVDSDGDGIPDATEANDANADGLPDTSPTGTDSDGDGLDDAFDPDSGGSPAPGPDDDGDGTPDYLDFDSDDDGIPDVIEAHDGDNDGDPDVPPSGVDADGDGLDDAYDPSEGGTPAPNPDLDGDGRPNQLDQDSDGDGIPDDVECPDPSLCPDTDNDGSPDYLDLDSDSDGIPDATEGHDADGDGIPDATPTGNDADDDGLDDAFDPDSGGTPAPTQDTDGDGVPDYQDVDDDGDAIPTAGECTDPAACPDMDGDGAPDYLDVDGPIVDTDEDGIPDVVECGGDPAACPDSDGDGMPDHMDDDDDNDGVPTSVEAPGGIPVNTDGNGGADHLDIDADDDGIPDAVECDGATCPDTDDDGVEDRLDLDTDGDGIPDATEGHDANMDGVPDTTPSGTDADNDGLDDAYDGDSGGTDAPTQDSDTDGVPDWRDTEDDGDGIDTAFECTTPGACPDADGDGMPDYLDTDGPLADDDMDGVPSVVECPPPLTPGDAACPDTDGDGMPDWNDTDDDNDGIPTADENYDGDENPADEDTDRDGIPDYLDPDDDNDGVDTRTECPTPGSCPDADGDGRPDYLDVCGDGRVTRWYGVTVWEQCDDGNTVSGDGCSASCRLEGPPCTMDSDCAEPTPRCDTSIDRCVECYEDTHCDAGQVCSDARMCVDAPTGCTMDSDCPAGEICDVPSMTCVPEGGCTSNADCGGDTPICDVDSGSCVECTMNSDCPTGLCDTGVNMCIDPADGGYSGGALCATSPGGRSGAPWVLGLLGLALFARRRR